MDLVMVCWLVLATNTEVCTKNPVPLPEAVLVLDRERIDGPPPGASYGTIKAVPKPGEPK